jgi:hypothetical protein
MYIIGCIESHGNRFYGKFVVSPEGVHLHCLRGFSRWYLRHAFWRQQWNSLLLEEGRLCE